MFQQKYILSKENGKINTLLLNEGSIIKTGDAALKIFFENIHGT